MSPWSPSRLLRSRRGLLLGGASAALGAAAVAVSEAPADAAAGAPLLIGRGNAAGTRSTSLTAAGARTAWSVVQRGAGMGASVSSAATALFGSAGLASAWGLHGRSAASRTGTGGALRGEGRRNAGLLADTTVQNVPAVVAIGGDGTGVAQVATGQSYFDGDALALRAWTGVSDTNGTKVVYAPLVSGETALHGAAGTAALDSDGTAVVALPATFTAACDMTTLSVTLTAVGSGMAGLFVTYRQKAGGAAGEYDGFTVGGGASGGSVAWAACATRRAVDLQQGTTAAAPSPGSPQRAETAPGSAQPAETAPGTATAPSESTAAAQPARVSRASLHLPAR
jgi:hypothetical protein